MAIGVLYPSISSHSKDILFGYINVEVATIASNVKPFISSPFDDCWAVHTMANKAASVRPAAAHLSTLVIRIEDQ